MNSHFFVLRGARVKKKTEGLHLGIAQTVSKLAEPVVAGLGFELVDTEYVKEGSDMVLRLYVDKPGGIGIDECETVSRAVEKVIDEADPIEGSYIFEVSSPGLDRPLKTDRDFERYKGELVELTFYAQEDGKKNVEGCLQKKENNEVYIKLESGEEVSYDMKKVALVRRSVRF